MRGRGRPKSDAGGVDPLEILAVALNILDADGLERLTMRALATRAGINPMTAYHHFKDRDGLIAALADSVYRDVAAPAEGDVRARLFGLLTAYHGRVVRHPALTLAIFGRPAVFPEHAKRITAELEDLVGALGLPPQRARTWVHILVDYTHGAALAIAMGGTENSSHATENEAGDGFGFGLAELLDALGAAD